MPQDVQKTNDPIAAIVRYVSMQKSEIRINKSAGNGRTSRMRMGAFGVFYSLGARIENASNGKKEWVLFGVMSLAGRLRKKAGATFGTCAAKGGHWRR